MRRLSLALVVAGLVTAVWLAQGIRPVESAGAKPDFDITASYIEACSCDMFCPCYFNEHSTMHGGNHFCKFNLVLKVDKGYYKDVKLDGVKAWLSGDLGSDWAKGKADWLVVTYEPSITKAQEAAMTDILLQLYPMEWNILGVDKFPIEWNIEQKSGIATSRLGNGKGEVILARWKGPDPSKEVVLNNIQYWAAQSNTGIRMWKNKRHYYEGHGQKLEFSGTNGFLITINFHGQAKATSGD